MPELADPLTDRALELAYEAAVETATDAEWVGERLGVASHDSGLITVAFACTLPGYRGWQWTVDLAAGDGEESVCESALLPGGDALLAPEWVPWSERVRPGDLEPSMALPFIAEDPRLVPGYTATGDADRDEMALFEFGLGRERVLAPEAREDTAERWLKGSHGPTAASAVASSAPCSMCAFFVPLSGSMRMAFGACANEWSPSDGKVVSVDHGCGAHSQTDAERRASEWPAPDPIVDSGALAVMDLLEPEPEPEPDPEPEPTPDTAPEAAIEADDTEATQADDDAAPSNDERPEA